MNKNIIMLKKLVYNYNKFGTIKYHPNEFKYSKELNYLITKYQKETNDMILHEYLQILQAYIYGKTHGIIYGVLKALEKRYGKFKKKHMIL